MEDVRKAMVEAMKAKDEVAKNTISFANANMRVSGILLKRLIYSRMEGRTRTLNLLTEFKDIAER